MKDLYSKIFLEKRDVILCFTFIIWLSLTTTFYNEIFSFIDSLFPSAKNLGPLHFVTIPLLAIFFLGPYAFSAFAFTDLIDLSLKDPRFHQNRLVISILLLAFTIFFLQFLVLSEFSYYFDAFLYTLQRPNYLKLAFISYVVFFFVKQSGKFYFEITKIAFWFLIITCLWTLYSSHGLDDGCTTVGGDPLFGGGGYENCDPDHIKLKDRNSQIANEKGFQKETLFAAEMLFTQITGLIAMVIALAFTKRFR